MKDVFNHVLVLKKGCNCLVDHFILEFCVWPPNLQAPFSSVLALVDKHSRPSECLGFA